MSDMTIFQGGLPAHLKNAELDDATKALMGNQATSGSSSKRISIKAGVFRMVVDGKEVAQNEDRSMNIIVAAAATSEARTFYAKAFVEGQAVTAPDCWSDLGDFPHAKAANPQAKRCLDCPQNIKGSSGHGESKACKYSRRLAVMLENDPQRSVFQLTVPSNSIWSSEGGKMGIKPYAEYLASNGSGLSQVVTKMSFDTASSSPKLHFKPVRLLDAEEFAVVVEAGKSDAAKKAIGSTPAQLDGARLPAPKKEDAPKAEAPKAEAKAEPEIKEPVKREKKAEAPKDVGAILDDWSNN